jgi:aspartate aminotransferase/aminotransferase
MTNAALIEQILKVNQHIITCPATILQYYMAKHFESIIEVTYPQIADVVRRRRQVAKFMDDIGLSYLGGTATFYFFVSTAPTKLTSEEFCMRLLKEEHICVVPGIGYGASCDGFVRVSVGTEPLEVIMSSLTTLKELIVKTAGPH